MHQQWEQAANGRIRCKSHPKVKPFSNKVGCEACNKVARQTAVEALAENPELLPDEAAPEGCRTQLQRESWFTGVANEAKQTAVDVMKLEKGTKGKPGDMSPKAINAAAKMYEVAIKAESRAAELGSYRERRRRVRRLEALGHQILLGRKRVSGGGTN